MAQKYGVIDIGTNFVRLMLASMNEKNEIKVHEKRLVACRTGEGIADDGFQLSPQAMERTIKTIDFFIKICQKVNVDEIYAFATSAVRNATNQAEFLERCNERLDLDIDVISGELEARIGFLGAVGVEATGRLIDIGGGSTEIIACEQGELILSGSVEMGVSRALQVLPNSSAGYIGMRKLFRNSMTIEVEKKKKSIEFDYSERLAKRFLPKMKKIQSPIYAVGGTVTTLAGLAIGLKTGYDPRLVQGYAITHGATRRVLAEIGPMPPKHRMKIPLLRDKADVFCFGCNILLTLMDDLGVTSVIASDRDGLEGYLLHKKLVAKYDAYPT